MKLRCDSDSKSIAYEDSFPWESLPKSASVGIASADKVAAVKVHIGIASAKLAVCRHLHAGMSRVSEAIVFDQLHLGLGNIDKLHCLHSTSQHIGMSNVKQITYHTEEELVHLALKKLGIEAATAVNFDQNVETPIATEVIKETVLF